MNKRLRFSKLIAFLTILSLLMQATALAQEVGAASTDAGSLLVLVTDDSGVPLDGCVSVTDYNGGVHERCANGGGWIEFTGLPYGNVSIVNTVSPEGHYPAVMQDTSVPPVILQNAVVQVQMVAMAKPAPVSAQTLQQPVGNPVDPADPVDDPAAGEPADPQEPVDGPTAGDPVDPMDPVGDPDADNSGDPKDPADDPEAGDPGDPADPEAPVDGSDAGNPADPNADSPEPELSSTPDPLLSGKTNSLSGDASTMAVTIQDPKIFCAPIDYNQGADITIYVKASEEFFPAPTFIFKETDRFGNEIVHAESQAMVWNAGDSQYDYFVHADPNRSVDFQVTVGEEEPVELEATCAQFNPIPVEIHTIAKDESGNTIPNGGRINPGTPFGDTATFVSVDPAFGIYNFGLEGQTVTYKLYKDAQECSGTPVKEYTVTLGENGAIPDSWSEEGWFTPVEEGTYDWQVVYAGDEGNFLAAKSECGSETVVVGKAQVSVDTVMQSVHGETTETITQGGKVPFGTTVRDTTILTGATEDASGTVTYTLLKGESCATAVQIGDSETVSVTGGIVPPSSSHTLDEQGTYHWVVTYSGDDHNADDISECGEETFRIGKFQPTITTVMMEVDESEPIAQGDTVLRGTEVYDTATITGAYVPEGEVLGGSITYTLYRGSCPDGFEVGSETLPLNEDGTLPNSPVFPAAEVGTYNWVVTYSGDAYNDEATSWCGSETFNVNKNLTTITTTPQVRTGDDTFADMGDDDVVRTPATVRDTAVIDNLTDDATGSVIFELYQGASCGGEAIFTDTVNISEAVDGVIFSGVTDGLEPGRYNWVVRYSGDNNNEWSESGCYEEQFFVTAPGVGGYVGTTVINDDTGDEVPNSAHVPLGTTVYDTAQFYGDIVENGNAAYSGSLTYTLYQGDTCGGEALGSWTVPVTAEQPIPSIKDAENGTHQFINAGTYNFQATFTYSDGENDTSIASPCNTERVIVDKATVTLQTVISAGVDAESLAEVAPGSRLTRPMAVKDGVEVTYSNQGLLGNLDGPNGTLTYELYGNAGCDAGTALETWSLEVVDGNFPDSGVWPLTEDDYGVYNWKVTFTPDTDEHNYSGAVSDCGQETFFLDAQPSLSTSMFWSETGEEDTGEPLADKDDEKARVGDFVRDTATLSGTTMDDGASNAGGTVTFTLYHGHECDLNGGIAVFSDEVDVENGELVRPTTWHKLQLFGPYSWKAEYSGDIARGGFNKPVTHCENETFTANEVTGLPVSMETVMRQGDDIIPHMSYVSLPASVTDQAIFTNLSNKATGKVTYELYNNAECKGSAVFTDVQDVVDGRAPRSAEYELPRVSGIDSRVYSWKVTFQGDGEFSNITAESECGEEQFRLFNSMLYSASTVCSYNADADQMSFTVYLNPRDVDDENDTPVKLTLQPYNNDLSLDDEIVYTDPAKWVIDHPNTNWRRVDGRAEWAGPAGTSWATFSIRCNTTAFNPVLTTEMFVEGDPDRGLENTGEVKPGTAIYDTTNVTGSTVIMAGTLTYKLYRGPICQVGESTLISNQVFDLGSGETVDDFTDADSLPDSDPVTLNDPGTYFWVVDYAPPAVETYPDNEAAVSDCETESFTVLPFDTTLTTLIVTQNGSATLAAVGEEIYDTTTMTKSPDVSTTMVPTGTVTYNLYAGTGEIACTGEPVWTSGALPLNANGTFPNSGITKFTDFTDVGDYEFQAVYESGDEAIYTSSASECGSEPLEITTSDVSIEKSVNEPTLNATDQIVFTLEIKNDGPGMAFGVVVTDELPVAPGLKWTIGGAGKDSCKVEEGVLTCTIDEMLAGASLTVTLTSPTTPETCGEIENTASIEASNDPGDGEGVKTSTANTEVLCPDVAIEKSVTPDTVNAGEELTYTLVITNIGEGAAYKTKVSDVLPGMNATPKWNWSIDQANSDNGCSITNGKLNCNFNTLDAADGGVPATRTVVLKAETSYGICDEVDNTAIVSATNEPTSAKGEDNSSTATATVNCAEVTLTKEADAATVEAGEQIGFTITVGNDGPGTAKDVTLRDQLPRANELDWEIESSDNTCTIENGILTCDFGDMAEDATKSVHIVSDTKYTICGDITNTAAIEANRNHPETSDSDTVKLLCADLVIEKTPLDTPVSAGDEIGFEITITNTGDTTARGVTFTEALPGDFTWTSQGPLADCTGDRTYTCNLDDMAPGAVITVTMTAPTTAEQCGDVLNTASADATNESNPDDNTAEATVTILCPDVAIEKTVEADTVNATDDVVFTLEISNLGDGDATGVVVTDPLPAGLTWGLVDAVDGCDIITDEETDRQTLKCELGTLDAGSDPVTVTVRAATTFETCATYENTAGVTSTNEAQDTETQRNNSSTATAKVDCADIVLTKVADDATVSAGDQIGFTLTVTNTGDGLARDVTLTDGDLQNENGLEWTIDEENSDTGCVINDDGVLECDFGDMATGATKSVHIVSPTTPDTCGTIDNDALVTSTNHPNREANASTKVNCPDVAIEKTVEADTVNATDDVVFTLEISNTGDGDATGVVVTDALPAGLTWGLVDAVNGCDIITDEETDRQTLKCELGTLDAGSDPVTVTVRAATTFETCATYENTAGVTSTNEAQDTETQRNNSSTATAKVDCADIVLTKVADDATVSAGDQIGFTLTVTNTGDGLARDVILTDGDLQNENGLEWTIDEENSDTGCVINDDGVLECDFGDMATGATKSVHIVSPTTPDTCGTIDNDALVTSTNHPNREANASTDVECPNIVVEKTAENAVISAGETISFDITVTNTGDGVARDVALTDDLPDGFNWSWTSDPADADCGINDDGVLTCNFGDMAPNASITVTVTAETNAGHCTEDGVPNIASAGATNENWDEENESGDTVTIQCPDLAIEKVAHSEAVNATDGVGFTISFTNAGPGKAFDVKVTDSLPSGTGLEWSIDEDASDDVCDIIDGKLICDFAEMAAGVAYEVHIVSPTTAETTCGQIENTASIEASNEPGDDDTQANNTSKDSTKVLCPDVEITKTAQQGTVNATDDVVFTLAITNSGDGDAYGVVVTDELPAGLNWSLVDEVAGCEIVTDEETGKQTLECIIEEMAPGDAGAVTVSMTAATSFETCGTYNNIAEVAADNESDARAQQGNSSSASVSVNCSDIVVSKVPDAADVSAGDQIGFTLTVTNTDEGDAYNVTLKDELRDYPGLEWTIDEGNSDTGCAINDDGVLECDFGDMATGATKSVHIVSPTTPDTCGTIDNTATVTSDNHPDAPMSGQVVVKCPNVVVAKTATDGNAFVSAGETISFDITVTNTGGGIAKQVALSDELPAGFAWSIEPANEACAIEDGVLTCDFGDMASEALVTVTVTAPTTAEQCGEVENTARAEADNEKDENTGDNEAEATVTIQCPSTSILKTTTTPSVSAGEEINFTIEFTNDGRGKAFDVSITDTLPTAEGLDWSLNPANEACDIEDGVLDCEFDTVEPETTITLTLVSPTTADSCGDIENTVNATASNDDPSRDEASVEVLCPDMEIEKTAETSVVSAGEQIGFTITVTNNGPGKAFDATLTDTLPNTAGLSWMIDTESSTEGCAIEEGILNCDFGTIEAEASVEVRITSATTAETCSTVENVASASFSNNETVEDGDEVEVLCPDVAIEKGADDEIVLAPEQIGFTIRFSNAGPGKAFNVLVTDTLPAVPGLTWTIDGGDAADLCEIGEDGVLTCTIGTMEPEATFAVRISSPTSAQTCSFIDNTAEISASNEPQDEDTQDDNESTASTTVLCPTTPAPPVVTQSVCTDGVLTDADVTAPETEGVTYTFDTSDVVNGGTVVVTATIQDGYGWPAELPEGWTKVDDSTATWTITLDEVECIEIDPGLPVVTQPVCKEGDYQEPTIVLPETPGVGYTVDGELVPGGKVVITATLEDGYGWPAEMSEGWTKVNDTTATFTVTLDNVTPCETPDSTPGPAEPITTLPTVGNGGSPMSSAGMAMLLLASLAAMAAATAAWLRREGAR